MVMQVDVEGCGGLPEHGGGGRGGGGGGGGVRRGRRRRVGCTQEAKDTEMRGDRKGRERDDENVGEMG